MKVRWNHYETMTYGRLQTTVWSEDAMKATKDAKMVQEFVQCSNSKSSLAHGKTQTENLAWKSLT